MGCDSIPLTINDAIDLLCAVSDFQFKDSEKRPDFCVYDNQNDGYNLRIKAELVDKEYRRYLNGIVKSRKLGLRESEGYLIIYGY
jgi:hypothetical protein